MTAEKHDPRALPLAYRSFVFDCAGESNMTVADVAHKTGVDAVAIFEAMGIGPNEYSDDVQAVHRVIRLIQLIRIRAGDVPGRVAAVGRVIDGIRRTSITSPRFDRLLRVLDSKVDSMGELPRLVGKLIDVLARHPRMFADVDDQGRYVPIGADHE